MTVSPKSFSGYGMSIAQLWGSGPKFTIACGQCGATFTKRVPMVDDPGVPCPNCRAVNVLPLVVVNARQERKMTEAEVEVMNAQIAAQQRMMAVHDAAALDHLLKIGHAQPPPR